MLTMSSAAATRNASEISTSLWTPDLERSVWLFYLERRRCNLF